jgi:hypothetical protein
MDKITVIARRPTFQRDNLLVLKGLLPWPAAGQALRNARNDSYEITLNEHNHGRAFG